MKTEERDNWDEQFRSKLGGLEAEPSPDVWEAIAARLPAKVARRFRLPRHWAYAAAAVLLALLVGGSFFFLHRRTATPASPTQVAQVFTAPPAAQESATKVDTAAITIRHAKKEEESISVDCDPVRHVIVYEAPNEFTSMKRDPLPSKSLKEGTERPIGRLLAEASVRPAGVKRKQKRWHFGAGALSLAGGTDNTVNTYLLRSSNQPDDHLMAMNVVPNQNRGNTPRTNVNHEQPLSFGLGVGYSLNRRFSLQSGLVYTLLRSQWETEGLYRTRTKQYLHFLGIPLGISYKIAEWKRIQLYASAGFMGEVNLAGREKTDSYSGREKTSTDVVSVRMKEPQFSANAHVGLSYPLWRFLSLYAEIGGAYYFDNGSSMETLYSEKPFYWSPRIGIRFGF